MQRRSIRRWCFRAVLLGTSLLIGVLFLELALRALGVSYAQFYQPDPICGAALKPDAEGWFLREGKAYIRINSAGLRDREHSLEKAPGTLRIAVLGDSYAEAFQVPVEETFWAVMEGELGSLLGPDGPEVEAINFGVGGYGTCQELLTLRHKALRYSPDIVILTFTSGNDVYNNSKALNLLDTIPYFVVQGDALVLDDGFLGWYRSRTTGLRAVYQSLLDRSSLLQLVKSLRYRSQRERRAQEQEAAALKTGGDAAGLAEAGLADRVYVEPTDETWRQAWDVTERIIVATRDEASQAGSRFLLVSVTNGIQVHPDPAVRKKAAEALRVADLTYPERRLAALAERTGIPYLALAPILQSHAEESGAFLHGFGDRLGTGHWNAEGHRIAGQLIARTIAGEILPKPPR